MKASAWRHGVLAGAIVAALCAAAGTAATGSGLPQGLPTLPSLGDTMQRSVPSGLALGGYDPVAYQAQQRAVPGLAAYELTHRGVTWRFASAANLAAFRDNPAEYEPAFAGFDPTGVADGRAVETDPRQFAIVASRLFLFRTAENRASFARDPGLLTMAETNWRDVEKLVER